MQTQDIHCCWDIACEHTTPCCRSTSASHCQWTVLPTWIHCQTEPTCWAERWTRLQHKTIKSHSISHNHQHNVTAQKWASKQRKTSYIICCKQHQLPEKAFHIKSVIMHSKILKICDCEGKGKGKSIAVCETSPHRYGKSLTIWDHTVLPATWQR